MVSRVKYHKGKKIAINIKRKNSAKLNSEVQYGLKFKSPTNQNINRTEKEAWKALIYLMALFNDIQKKCF